MSREKNKMVENVKTELKKKKRTRTIVLRGHGEGRNHHRQAPKSGN